MLVLFFIVKDAKDSSFGGDTRFGIGAGDGGLATGGGGRRGDMPIGGFWGDGSGEFNDFNCCCCACASLSSSSFFRRCS